MFGGQPAQYAHGVFAFNFEAGVGETLDEFAGGGQDEQAAGVDVQASDGDPAAAGGLRQAVEDADAALRVVAGDDFAFLFVIQDDARQAVCPFEFDDAAFDGNVVVGGDFVTQLRGFAVDRYPAVVDPLFHFAARTDAGRGKHFLQAFGLHARQVAAALFQIARAFHDFLVGIADDEFSGFGGTLFGGVLRLEVV
ncbi:hypothetical protein NEISICOT_01328 [Neisseria sicca ATCC 29256]|uniref:Uncharacterized protein n=1 Tax=Neisseria sicca ATCC 29256 TaxID=547045 RepID=C6M485_NEISI|nr:hypothetical protein NEISICOT_01328 [Neisseria sicca ATCC 29256]